MWQIPKTDWTEDYYFNIEDYNRINGNIRAIQDLSSEVNPEFEITYLPDKTSYSDYVYADEFNMLEQNLAVVTKGTYPYVAAEARMYYANQPTPDYSEFNRIETLLLQRYVYLESQMKGRRMLSFTLGGGEF